MDHLAPIRAFQPAERRVLAQMLRQGFNAPITTSAGRLFDGIAALVGLPGEISFEGQAAMALEFAADAQEMGAYQIELRAAKGERETSGVKRETSSVKRQASSLDWGPLVVSVLADLRRGVSQGMIAARFHNALVEAIVEVAQRVGVARVALTGGCFQNRLLTERAAGRLAAGGFEVLLHRQVPPNDGGISLGQVMAARASIK